MVVAVAGIAGVSLLWLLAALKPATSARLTVFAATFTSLSLVIPVGGVNLRPETLMIPPALLSIALNGKGKEPEPVVVQRRPIHQSASFR